MICKFCKSEMKKVNSFFASISEYFICDECDAEFEIKVNGNTKWSDPKDFGKYGYDCEYCRDGGCAYCRGVR